MRALLLGLLLGGCYAAHRAPGDPVPCAEAPPLCTARPAPCAPRALVAAVCEEEVWRCPAGAAPYAPPWADDVCLPLAGAGPTMVDGVHDAPVALPLGDRCVWAVPSEDGTALGVMDVGPSCAALGPLAPLEVAAAAGFDYLAVQQALELPGGPAALVRGWRFDALAPFGVRAVGAGIAPIDGAGLGSPLPWLFGEDTDLGDAAVLDGGFVYAYGCPGAPRWLVEDCVVGRAPVERAREPAAWSILGDGGWGAGAPVVVFGSGPHRGPVLADPRGGFVHVYAAGFGGSVEIARSGRPEGPWSGPTTLLACELPAADPNSYCAGPIVHLELFDPLRPDEIVVSYAIGTTAPDGPARRAADPLAYWPRMVRVRW
jgi:hypothetical protein